MDSGEMIPNNRAVCSNSPNFSPVRIFVNPVYKGQMLFLRQLCNSGIGGNHKLFDHFFRFPAGPGIQRYRSSGLIEDKARLRAGKIQNTAFSGIEF